MFLNKKVIKFEWDKGNIEKNKKHKVKDIESEEVFFDENKVTLKDKLHSGKEERSIVIGKTKKKRLLFIAFTMRGTKIKIISARNINKKEVSLYEKTA